MFSLPEEANITQMPSPSTMLSKTFNPQRQKHGIYDKLKFKYCLPTNRALQRY